MGVPSRPPNALSFDDSICDPELDDPSGSNGQSCAIVAAGRTTNAADTASARTTLFI